MPILSIRAGIPNDGRDPMSDYVFRHQVEAFNKVDEATQFTTEVIRTTQGIRETPVDVVLKYQPGTQFVFACFSDNIGFANRPESEWFETARKALHKFAALRDLQIKMGPSPEFGRGLNLMIELNKNV